MATSVSSAPPASNSALLSRLSQYNLFITAKDYYQTIKDSSSLAKSGLDLCENVAMRGIQVSIPIIKKVDEYTHVDERSVVLLDAIEARASQTKSALSSANTVAHQPLDTLLDALDKYLPDQKAQMKGQDDQEAPSDPHSFTPVGKIRAIGERVGNASLLKLRDLQLRGPNHQEAIQNITELIKYAYRTLHLNELGDSVSTRVHDTQQVLFTKAANAATTAQSYASAHFSFYDPMEKALEPHLKNAKSALEKQALILITAFGSAFDMTTHFFANTQPAIGKVFADSANRAAEWIKNARNSYPNFDKYLNQLIDGGKFLVAKAYNIALSLANTQMNAIGVVYNQLFDVLENLEHYFIAANKMILENRKQDADQHRELQPMSSERSQASSSQSKESEHSKKKKNGGRHADD